MHDPYVLPGSRRIFQLFAVFVLTFLVLPAVVVVPVSLSSGSIIAFPLPGVSLQWYREALSAPAWRQAAVNSAIIGLGASTLATVLGLGGALGLDRLSPRPRAAVMSIVLLPFLVPVVLVALGGYLGLAILGMNNTYVGIIALHAAIGLPFVVISVATSLRSFDRTLWRAAIGLGAPPLLAFRWVLLPLILPGVVTGAVFAFAASFDEVVVASFVTGPSQRTLPLHMFAGIKENTGPIVTAVATLLLLTAGCFLTLVELLQRWATRLQGRDGA
jgi:putative spermidine/putrescine transport system permease protein